MVDQHNPRKGSALVGVRVYIAQLDQQAVPSYTHASHTGSSVTEAPVPWLPYPPTLRVHLRHASRPMLTSPRLLLSCRRALPSCRQSGRCVLQYRRSHRAPAVCSMPPCTPGLHAGPAHQACTPGLHAGPARPPMHPLPARQLSTLASLRPRTCPKLARCIPRRPQAPYLLAFSWLWGLTETLCW